MSGRVISPDGRYVLINGEWVELAQQQVSFTDSVIVGDLSLQPTVNLNTRQPEEEIRNLAELALLKLKSGDMAAVNEVYTEAKKINVAIAQKIFEDEYSIRIGTGYVEIVELYSRKITTTAVTVSGQSFDSAGILWNVTGNHELSAIIAQQNIALGNALSFLGTPSEYAKLSLYELGDVGEQKLEQLYRLGQICKYSGNTVLVKTNEAYATIDGVTFQFISQLRLKALELSSIGSVMIANITSADVKSARFQMPNWQTRHSTIVKAANTSEIWPVELQEKMDIKAKNDKLAQQYELLTYIIYASWILIPLVIVIITTNI